jgi:serine/threonine protein kinase
MKFQNVMLASPPVYDNKGRLDVSSVEIKVVDFGIFGSIAGIKRENINCGSLKYMAPELLQGNYQSTPKIDIWSLGLMLHGLIFGYLPFNKPDRPSLEKQIINEELNYKTIKRIRTETIKDEKRKHLNI